MNREKYFTYSHTGILTVERNEKLNNFNSRKIVPSLIYDL